MHACNAQTYLIYIAQKMVCYNDGRLQPWPRPPLERGSDLGGLSTPLREKGVVEEVIEELTELVGLADNPKEAMAKIKTTRERLLQQAQVLASTKYQME